MARNFEVVEFQLNRPIEAIDDDGSRMIGIGFVTENKQTCAFFPQWLIPQSVMNKLPPEFTMRFGIIRLYEGSEGYRWLESTDQTLGWRLGDMLAKEELAALREGLTKHKIADPSVWHITVEGLRHIIENYCEPMVIGTQSESFDTFIGLPPKHNLTLMKVPLKVETEASLYPLRMGRYAMDANWQVVDTKIEF